MSDPEVNTELLKHADKMSLVADMLLFLTLFVLAIGTLNGGIEIQAAAAMLSLLAYYYIRKIRAYAVESKIRAYHGLGRLSLQHELAGHGPRGVIDEQASKEATSESETQTD